MIERNKEIVGLWNADKLSTSQIASKIGVTKNTVIGVIRRARIAGLITREVVVDPAARGKLGGKKKGWRERSKKMAKEPKGSLPKLFIAASKEEAQDTEAVGVSFADLRHDGCRYPTSRFEGEHYFCGEPKRDTRTSYCEKHHTLCWNKKMRMTELELLRLKGMYAKRAWMQSKGNSQ
jgi:hypothetical protein